MRTTLLVIALLAAATPAGFAGKSGRHQEWWSNGLLRSDVNYAYGVLHGTSRTWYPNGQLYELRHYKDGREEGLQQSWTEKGELYLNYVFRHGRRYGFVNAKPCVPVKDGRS